jgi:hypothetical protein
MSDFATVCTNSLDQLETAATQIATFNVGSRVTAIAWSSRTVSPSLSDDWSIESVDATIHGRFGLPSHRFGETGLLWRRQTLGFIYFQSPPLNLRRSSRLAVV